MGALISSNILIFSFLEPTPPKNLIKKGVIFSFKYFLSKNGVEHTLFYAYE